MLPLSKQAVLFLFHRPWLFELRVTKALPFLPFLIVFLLRESLFELECPQIRWRKEARET